MTTSAAPIKARVLRAMKMAAYVCGNRHRFAVDTETEPRHYVVSCPVCGDKRGIEENR